MVKWPTRGQELARHPVPTHVNDPLGFGLICGIKNEDLRLILRRILYIGHQSCPPQVHGSSYHSSRIIKHGTTQFYRDLCDVL